VNAQDHGGRTPLSLATVKRHEEVVRLLLARDDVDANFKDWVGRTPLSCAAAKGAQSSGGFAAGTRLCRREREKRFSDIVVVGSKRRKSGNGAAATGDGRYLIIDVDA
jgi:hypothetical protein